MVDLAFRRYERKIGAETHIFMSVYKKSLQSEPSLWTCSLVVQAQRCGALRKRYVRLDSAVLDRPATPSAPEIPDDLTSTSQVFHPLEYLICVSDLLAVSH